MQYFEHSTLPREDCDYCAFVFMTGSEDKKTCDVYRDAYHNKTSEDSKAWKCLSMEDVNNGVNSIKGGEEK